MAFLFYETIKGERGIESPSPSMGEDWGEGK